jgi:hypothetical protein
MAVPSVPVYVINLDHRVDRWENIKKISHSCGIQPIRVSAVKASPGWHGCGLSHKKVAEIARENNDPWYLVLEDDAVFSQDQWKAFINLLPWLYEHKSEWDIFTGGVGSVEHFQLISKFPLLYEVKGFCSHFYLVNISAYNTFISWDISKPAFDNYAKGMRMISTYPFISTQIESPSDLAGGNGPYQMIAGAEADIAARLREAQGIEAFRSYVKSQTPLQKIMSYFNF